MEQLSFRLEVFEGPLDLLLHLIRKHKLNINDISITVLVDQYLDYIGRMAQADMEISGEFLETAAQLIYLKTVSLLPRREESETLKKELEGRLIEYSLCKQTAQLLKQMYNGGAVTVKPPMKVDFDTSYALFHDPEVLREAYLAIGAKKPKEEPVTAAAFSALVSKKFVPVTARIVYILKNLYEYGTCALSDIYGGASGRSERVATFLAVLELTRSGRIVLNDDNTEITFNSEYRADSISENIHSDFDDDGKESTDDDRQDSGEKNVS